jgi:hypothetical protein
VVEKKQTFGHICSGYQESGMIFESVVVVTFRLLCYTVNFPYELASVRNDTNAAVVWVVADVDGVLTSPEECSIIYPVMHQCNKMM